MAGLIIRLVVNAVALWVASVAVNMIAPGGMSLTTELPSVVIVALIFGVVNALIKPIVSLLSCPLTILTLGLFTFVINALMLLLTSNIVSWIGDGEWLRFSDFWMALLTGIIVSVVNTVLSMLLSSDI